MSVDSPELMAYVTLCSLEFLAIPQMTPVKKLPSPGEAAAAFLHYHAEDAGQELAALQVQLAAQADFGERGSPQPYIEAAIRLRLNKNAPGPRLHPVVDLNLVRRAIETWVTQEFSRQECPLVGKVSVRSVTDTATSSGSWEFAVRVTFF